MSQPICWTISNTRYILKIEHKIQNHHIHSIMQEYANHPLPLPYQRHPRTPLYILKNPTQSPLHTIHMIAMQIHIHWSTNLQKTHIPLMPMDVPKWNNLQQVAATKRPSTPTFYSSHNTTPRNNINFTTILQLDFHQEQRRDTRYIPPPT